MISDQRDCIIDTLSKRTLLRWIAGRDEPAGLSSES
jgi:hypothetical protein